MNHLFYVDDILVVYLSILPGVLDVFFWKEDPVFKIMKQEFVS